MAEYKKTLNLPVTGFPMKANLVQKEPEMLKFWESSNVFQLMQDASGSRGEYRLHDGPPYANGHIHLGHALNKILKDIIIKSRNLMGWKTGYIPGWDCHGLPIEHNVEVELGEKKKDLPAHAIRKRCRQYAQKFLDIQRKEFKRLGVLGDWDHPYQSMDPKYEAVTAGELATFVERGSLVRSKKPIYWCCHCKTALAEAEVEYRDLSSPSLYVRFPLTDARLKDVFEQADPSRPYMQVAVKAILPAVLYFAGIFIAVHLEAKKLGLKGVSKDELPKWSHLARKVYLMIPLVLLVWLVSSGQRTMQFSAALAIAAAMVVGFLNRDERLTFGKIAEALEA
ncbi:MAG: class I tRNA ligase family protein, partial [Mailhella sp.]|nr:class I tRNA ligase family protein [Mailhella sp.]